MLAIKTRADAVLLFVTIILAEIGLVMVYSTSSILAYQQYGDAFYFLKKQFIWVLIGVIVMVVLSNISYQTLCKMSGIILIFTIILLVLVLVPHIGKSVGGARRWLGLGPVNFQPSELVKVALALYMADSLSKKGENIKNFTNGVFPYLLIIAILGLLLIKQPDLGTAVITGLIGMILLFTAGARISHISVPILCAIPALYLLISNTGYRYHRILAFLKPWEDPKGIGFQMVQSFIALGSGGIFGVGLGESKQKLFYLPAAHTDFIFSIIGEELGLIGTSIIIILFIVILIRGMRVVIRVNELSGKLLATGITAIIFLQAVLNIAVATGSMPTKGLACPFISYGGSSLVFNMASIGILLNISKNVQDK